MGQAGTADCTAALLVDPDERVTDSLVSEVNQSETLRVVPETQVASAREQLAADPPDCLVVDTDPLPERGAEFVPDARTVAPDCPVVALTGEGTDDIPQVVRSRATTLVERSDCADNARFLIEKIRSAVRDGDTERNGVLGRDGDELYRELVETARDGLYRLDAEGEMVYANESLAEMLGYSRDEMLGSHASRAMADGSLARGQRRIQEILEREECESDIIDMEMVTKDGERITVAAHVTVLTTAEGAYDGVIGVVRDVTERRERKRELERTNERLEEFVSVVSHDLRNPLNVVRTRIELAQSECDSTHLDHAAAAVSRGIDLVEDLQALARHGEQATDVAAVDIAEAVDDCWRTVETGDRALVVDAERAILADPSRLKQLLENLIRNAVEHGGDDVTVTVADTDDGFYVADDGPGIPASERDEVLEAGYSTSRDGTGFGLSIVKEIAQAHDWEITVTDSESGGARFDLTGVERPDG